MNKRFINVCITGTLKEAQEFHLKHKIKITNNNGAFRRCCRDGKLDVAKWLHSSDIDVSCSDNQALMLSCKHGQSGVVKWLDSIGTISDDDIACIFYEMCTTSGTIGRLKMAQLLNSLGKITTAHKIEALYSCSEYGDGDIEIIKWLCSFEGININNHNSAFVSVCSNNHLNVAKWMYENQDKEDPINIMGYADAFKSACINKHILVAHWLYQERKGDVNLRAHNDNIFRWCCENSPEEHICIIQWLATLCDDYSFSFSWGNFVSYSINTPVKRAMVLLEKDNYNEAVTILKINKLYVSVDGDGDCQICLDKCDHLVKTNCNHYFCLDSLIIHLTKYDNCPYCRQKIILKQSYCDYNDTIIIT